MEETYPCPACGFLQFSGPPGTYEICELCGWEDDHVQLANPRLRGGANSESLVEAQQVALRRYPQSVRDYDGEVRDPGWRPLTNAEATRSPEGPRTGLDYFRAASSKDPTYYWRKDDPNDNPV